MQQAWTIPKAEKNKGIDKSLPGPGTYRVPRVEVVQNEAPIWTIKGKYPDK